MKFFSWFKNESEEKPQADFNKGWKTLVEWLGLDDKVGDALSDATYYTCLKILSETIGKLPLKMYQDTDKGVIKSDKQELYNLLKLRPNPYMTSAVFWATVEMNRNHHGNAYVWIRYNGVEPKDLWIMQSENVEHVIDDAGLFGEVNNLWYKYTDPKTNKIYVIPSDNVMHFKTSMTFDGIKGKPVRDILKETVNGNLHSQKFMTNLYKTGLTGKAVLEYTGELDDKSKKRLVKGFEEFSSGSKNAGKIIPVPLGMKLVPLNIKLTDSQFFELKKYNALQVAGAFGIKPNQINDYQKSSYASAESQNLAFYVDTILFIVKQYEEEITYKLLSQKLIDSGYYWRFNVNVILRADSKTQMESLAIGVNNGIIKPDEARNELDRPIADGGDRLYANGNYIPLTLAGKQYGAVVDSEGGEE